MEQVKPRLLDALLSFETTTGLQYSIEIFTYSWLRVLFQTNLPWFFNRQHFVDGKLMSTKLLVEMYGRLL